MWIRLFRKPNARIKTATVDIMYGEGVSHEGELIELASNAGIIDKSGAWFSYKGEKIGQGKENVKLMLKENKELCKEIEDATKEYYGIAKKETKKDK